MIRSTLSAVWTPITRVCSLLLLGTALALVGASASAQEQPQQTQSRADDSGYLESRVENQLARSPSLAGSRIEAQVQNRTVTLTGTVASEGDKERATRIAHDVIGITEVQNQLRVDATAVDGNRGDPVEDQELARTIATSLANETFPGAQADEEWLYGWEVEGEDWEFDVDVDGGDVMLEGSVDEFADIGKATSQVREMPGVRSVEANLRVEDRIYERGDLDTYPHGPYYGRPYWRP